MDSFLETGLSPDILSALDKLGFVKPTPIQAKTIPHLLSEDNDLVALAQTGTGKTAAFGLPLIELTDVSSNTLQSLILCPTRELAIQIEKDVKSFSAHLKGFKVTSVYGGTQIFPQINALKSGVHMVVATPGRAVDLINRKALRLDKLTHVVLDEADEMLNMGFRDDLDFILGSANKDRQTLLFSATMPKEVKRIADEFLFNPDEIEVGQRNTGSQNVSHEFYMVHSRDRYNALKRFVDIHPKIYAIVFCRTRRETKEVAAHLMNDGYNADALHGDLSQAQRDTVMEKFRARHLQILVATDVAARGLDVNELTHVINYNLPDDLEAYIHRSGRTGRAGKKGVSVAIVHTREQRRIKEIEKAANVQFERKMVPNGKDICEKQLFNLIDKVEHTQVDTERIEPYMDPIYKKLAWLSREELIQHFVYVEFSRFLEYYKDADDINVLERSRDEKGRRDAKGGRDERGDRNKKDVPMKRFHLSFGKKDNITPKILFGLINKHCKQRNIEIGSIDLLRNFSFINVEERAADSFMKDMNEVVYKGKKLLVTEASEPKGGKRGSNKKRRK